MTGERYPTDAKKPTTTSQGEIRSSSGCGGLGTGGLDGDSEAIALRQIQVKLIESVPERVNLVVGKIKVQLENGMKPRGCCKLEEHPPFAPLTAGSHSKRPWLSVIQTARVIQQREIRTRARFILSAVLLN